QVTGIARPDHEARGLPRIFWKLVDGAAGHREVAVRHAEIGAQVGAVERGLQRHERIELLGHLPEQEVAVTPDAHQPVRPQQHAPAEALDRLAELDLRARLALGRQTPPRAVELVEGESNDLTLL